MREDAPALLPIFRSAHQARLLATLLLHPDREYTITDLAHEIGVPTSTLHREVGRLVTAGIIRSRTVGRTRLLAADTSIPLHRPLADLLALTYGPLTVVAEEFEGLADVDLVAIYGSWAARYQDQPGPPPNDVDVLVVGAPARGAVYDAAERAARRLGVPVSPTISSPRRWAEARDALVQQIRSSPLVPVVERRPGPEEVRP